MRQRGLQDIPGGAAFLAWWQALPRAGAAAAPRLSDYLDRPHPEFAPWSIVVDVIDPDNLPIRLFGTRLSEAFGEKTGHNYLDYMPGSDRQAIGRGHMEMCRRPCGRLSFAAAATNAGREVVLGMVSLPVVADNGIARILKLTRVIDQLEYSEVLPGVHTVLGQAWVDLGAGIPADAADC